MSSISQQRLTYEEISQLNQRKDELKAQHQGYLDEHTEIPRMLSDFMSAVLLLSWTCSIWASAVSAVLAVHLSAEGLAAACVTGFGRRAVIG